MQELAMTFLGKIVFGDLYNRQNQPFTDDESSERYVDSLSLAYENLLYMPFDMIEKYSATISTLDISHNRFSRNFHFLVEFDKLTSLNLDYNNIDEHTVFPYMPKLELLWLNHNYIKVLYPFIKNLHRSVPNLKYLSLMGNEASPSYLNGGSLYDYLQCRLFVISWFPELVHLDDSKVTFDEWREAKKIFKRSLVDDLIESTAVPRCIKHLRDRITSIFYKSDKEKMPNVLNTII